MPEGFVMLIRRWVKEKTLAWLGKSRRTAKDYEALPEVSEALVYQVVIRVMLKRLARNHVVNASRTHFNPRRCGDAE